MRLTELQYKIKSGGDIPKDIAVFLLIGLVGIGGFLLGKISINDSKRLGELSVSDSGMALPAFESTINKMASTSSTTPTPKTGAYVGSRSGTTYHLPWCSGAKRIKEENKVWFATKQEAESKGYKPAGNCKGI